ncbi:MAG: TSUP family transporter [Thermoleophilaceae bacterium]
MDALEIGGIVAVGFAAGVFSGLLGVGGGVVFVPGLVLLVGASQLEAEATSLLAVVVVATAGAWRQHGYGNLRLRDGVLVGVLSPVGVVAGVVVANAVSERALELGFAAVQLYFAWRLVRHARGVSDAAPAP